ncbi:hypothetical protein [Streptodolium elevatio]|uniref:Uncharacterized protein n=1 Tax=Streptodolium elevatio TaxID=3157996 RepID=A0ABV3DTZ0_9ACTN
MPPGWADAFADVPRAAFVPDLAWVHDLATGTYTPPDHTRDPEG